MGKMRVLIKEFAARYLKDNDSVALSEFDAIENAAAEKLSNHEGNLSLKALTSLSEAAAKSLGNQIMLR